MSFAVDTSSEEEVAQPTKLSQFLKAPSPSLGKSDRELSTSACKEDKSDRNERDRQRNQQAARGDRSDRQHISTQQRLLALAQYSDEPGSEKDVHDSRRHSHHRSAH